MTKENRQALTKKHEKTWKCRENEQARRQKHVKDHPELYGN